ncbi:MAG: methylenetetrahydrofolate reductase [NAD(P)H] [Verrucomicrobiales bacterium]|nr:methylenetetrahydrofolate reductase [NAD(P)H] [Verrucomicrobiales bacterium]
MRFIRDIHAERHAENKPCISFEFFPPKTAEGDKALLEKHIPALMELKPDYCSVTYGAGGSTKEKTADIVESVQNQHQLTTMMHLTCVEATRSELEGVVADAKNRGVKNVLALRGDPPGGGEFRVAEGGFEFSYQLVEMLKEQGDLSIGTAGFPEGHIHCTEGKYVDWERLANKVRCGADFVITQLFFDNADYFEFVDHLRDKHGITVPIVPGVLPIISAGLIKRFTQLCGAKLPDPLVEQLEACANDDEVKEFGIEFATKQLKELIDRGAPGVHFYTLNKAYSTTKIMQNLGLA